LKKSLDMCTEVESRLFDEPFAYGIQYVGCNGSTAYGAFAAARHTSIWGPFSLPSTIMCSICSRCEAARLDAMLACSLCSLDLQVVCVRCGILPAAISALTRTLWLHRYYTKKISPCCWRNTGAEEPLNNGDGKRWISYSPRPWVNGVWGKSKEGERYQ